MHKQVLIGSDVFVLRQMTPADFLGDPDGCPVCMFQVKTVKTKYEQMMERAGRGEDKAAAPEEQLKAIRAILGRSVVSRNGVRFNVHEYLATDTDMEMMLALLNESIALSFSWVIPVQISDSELERIDAIAQRYGIAPIDVLMPTGGYTPLDAFTFNAVVAGKGISCRNKVAKQAKLQWMVSLQ